MIDELESNPVIMRQVQEHGKFDTEFLESQGKGVLGHIDDDEDEVESEVSDQSSLYIAAGLLAAVGAVGLYTMFKKN